MYNTRRGNVYKHLESWQVFGSLKHTVRKRFLSRQQLGWHWNLFLATLSRLAVFLSSNSFDMKDMKTFDYLKKKTGNR